MRQGRQSSEPHPPSTPWVPPSVAAEPPSFPQLTARNLLLATQHTHSISECSLQTNLQDFPQHSQKVYRHGAKIKQKLLLGVIWPGHHFPVLLLQLMLLPLSLVTFGAPQEAFVAVDREGEPLCHSGAQAFYEEV